MRGSDDGVREDRAVVVVVVVETPLSAEGRKTRELGPHTLLSGGGGGRMCSHPSALAKPL